MAQNFKGIAIKLRPDGKAVALFDTDLLRFSAWWTGGFIELSEGRDGLGDHHHRAPADERTRHPPEAAKLAGDERSEQHGGDADADGECLG